MFITACRNLLRPGKSVAETSLLTGGTLILLLSFSLCAHARGTTQKLNLYEKDAGLDKVFREITRQTGYTFVYTEGLLQKAKKITIKVTDVSLEQALQECFKDQSLSFSISNRYIIIKEKEAESPKEKLLNSPPPPINVTGVVRDEKGQALPDISVLVKGTSLGTRTDNNGRFTLAVNNANSILVFSSIGYTAIEMPLAGKT